ncbi:ABC transporter permease [Paenibacillus sp. GCM10027627]|uniref:ABC transporter permease n=1 Tax=unclassified Paenibacillus TaxID=185978 RepID=UPI003644D3D2
MKSNTGVLFGRLMRHILRSPDTIITVAITPIAIMLMFVYVFGGSVKAGIAESMNIAVSEVSYVNYLLPGILLIAVASGIAYTAVRVFDDMQKGLFARFHSMPISRSSVLWGHVLTSLVSNTITIVLIFGVALIMGFRSSAGLLEWLAVAGILALFTLALTWLAVLPGLTAKTMEGATAFSYPLIFLPMISSAFAPTETMPKVVRAFAENQPVTSIVDTVRSLLSSEPVGNDIWIALAWCLGLLIVAYLFAMRAYNRKAA